jgi:Rrf2 family protein
MRRPKMDPGRSSLMHVGRRVDYAVRALAYLSAQPPGRMVSKVEIGKKQDIPSRFLSKIMRDLVVSGLVKSRLGSKGGFSLAKPANAITIKDIYEAVEGPLAIMACIEHGDTYCWFTSVCSQISVWNKAQSLLATFLAKFSIGDIADQQGLRERLMSFHGQPGKF